MRAPCSPAAVPGLHTSIRCPACGFDDCAGRDHRFFCCEERDLPDDWREQNKKIDPSVKQSDYGYRWKTIKAELALE